MKNIIETALERPFATMMVVSSVTVGVANIIKAISLIGAKNK